MFRSSSVRAALRPFFGALTLTAAGAASADLIAVDSEYGPGTITRDTQTGLDWLDVTVTQNRSVTDITAELVPGGEFEGFRYATTDEIAAMWTSADVAVITFEGPINGDDFYAENFDAESALVDLFGVTLVLPGGSPASEGFTANTSPSDPNLRIVAELTVCSNPNGCPLIGAPTGTALASLGPNTKNPANPVSFVGHHLVRPTPDSDGDAVPDDADNCTAVANPDQRDTNGDGFGNLCDPDLDDDCMVNFNDLAAFKLVIFTSDPDADFDGNGFVNFLDLARMKSNFFQAPGPSGVASCD